MGKPKNTSGTSRAIPGLILILLILAGDIISGAIGISSPVSSNVTLGIWNNFPTTTQCTASLDSCELFGTNLWRAPFDMGTVNTGYGAHLIVNCINPSNTPGAFLQLQFATVTLSTMANASNWVNIGSQVFIDNAVHTGVLYPCPGQLKSDFPSQYASGIPGQPPDFLLFRAIGNGGGGIGDNPRLGLVAAQVFINFERVGYPVVFSKSTTGFTAREYMTFQAASANVMSFSWEASNITTTSCGVISNHCWEYGSSSCTMVVGAVFCASTITFNTAFSITPQVFITNTIVSGISNSFVTLPTIPLFSASQ